MPEIEADQAPAGGWYSAFGGLPMIARVSLIAAAAMAVCACTSTAPERTSLQGSFYMVGDNVAPSKASTAAAPTEAQGQFSVVKRVYWFFAGR